MSIKLAFLLIRELNLKTRTKVGTTAWRTSVNLLAKDDYSGGLA